MLTQFFKNELRFLCRKAVLTRSFQLIKIHINFNLTEDSSKNYANAMPDYFVEELCLLEDPFLVSTSIINLKRLGIIEITEGGLTGENYDSMKSNQYVTNREKLYRQRGAYDFTVKITEHALILNNYGKQFIKICLPNGGR